MDGCLSVKYEMTIIKQIDKNIYFKSTYIDGHIDRWMDGCLSVKSEMTNYKMAGKGKKKH